MPARQPKRSRIWDGDGSCLRLRAEHRDHVWSYDFVEARPHDGRKFRMLNVVDEFSRECLTIRIARKLKAADVIDVPSDLFILRGVPVHIRSDNGPEFIAKSVRGAEADTALTLNLDLRMGADHIRLAGCAHPTGSAGQATRGAEADTALTLNLDHRMGADQSDGWRAPYETGSEPNRPERQRPYKHKLMITIPQVDLEIAIVIT